MGSFIRFKDGFKRGHAHYFDEDEDVYHIMYINKNLDNPENATEFNFYINKDTYLIRFSSRVLWVNYSIHLPLKVIQQIMNIPMSFFP